MWKYEGHPTHKPAYAVQLGPNQDRTVVRLPSLNLIIKSYLQKYGLAMGRHNGCQQADVIAHYFPLLTMRGRKRVCRRDGGILGTRGWVDLEPQTNALIHSICTLATKKHAYYVPC